MSVDTGFTVIDNLTSALTKGVLHAESTDPDIQRFDILVQSGLGVGYNINGHNLRLDNNGTRKPVSVYKTGVYDLTDRLLVVHHETSGKENNQKVNLGECGAGVWFVCNGETYTDYRGFEMTASDTEESTSAYDFGAFVVDPSHIVAKTNYVPVNGLGEGTFDITNITQIHLASNGTPSGNYFQKWSKMGYLEPYTIYGGTVPVPTSFEDLFTFTEAENIRIFSKLEQGVYKARCVVKIGKAGEITVFDASNETVFFPTSSQDNTGANRQVLVPPNTLGLDFTDLSNFSTAYIGTITGQTPYKIIANPADNGSIDFVGSVTNAGVFDFGGLNTRFVNANITDCNITTFGGGSFLDTTFTNCIITDSGSVSVTTGNTLSDCEYILDTAGIYEFTPDKFVISGTLDVRVQNSSGNITIRTEGQSGVNVIDETTGTGTYTLDTAKFVDISAPNIIDGSKIRFYNITKDLEVDIATVSSGGNGYTFSVDIAGALANEGDIIQMRVAYQSGLTAKIPIETEGILTELGLTFIDTQEELTAYGSLGIDGSLVTEYSLDGANLQIDINDGDGQTEKRRLLARYYYFLTLDDGIRLFFGAMELEDEANAVVDRTKTALMLDNISTQQLQFIDDDFRLYTSDGSQWILPVSTGGYGINSDSGKVYALETGTSGLTASESAQLMSLPQLTEFVTVDTGETVAVTGSVAELSQGDTGSAPTVQEIVDGVWDEPITGASHNDPTSAGRRLRQASTPISAEGAIIGTPTDTVIQTNLTQTDDNFYNDQTFVMVSGSLAGQARIVTSYDGTTKTFTFDEAWTVAPSVTDEFAVLADHVHPIAQIQEGLGTRADLTVINDGVKKSSKIIPHNADLP